MRKPLFFGLLSLLIFIGVIVLRAPASPIWRLLAPQVTSALPGLVVSRVTGTVWDGQAQLQYANMLPGNVTWQVSGLELLSERLAFAATINGDAHNLQITGSASLSELSIDTFRGTLDGRYLSQYGQRYQMQLGGELNILSLRLITTQRWPLEAAGQITWSGGAVSIPGPGGRQYLQLPALRGELTMLDQSLQLQIRETASDAIKDEGKDKGKELLTVVLQPSGWAKVAIKTRMFMLASIDLPGGQRPDDMALTLEEKIF
jgi:hypothetical protein